MGEKNQESVEGLNGINSIKTNMMEKTFGSCKQRSVTSLIGEQAEFSWF